MNLIGKNVLTVLLSKAEESRRVKMFFCPYTRNITSQYQGEVQAIMPGFDPDENPQIIIRPQRLEHSANIQYSFKFVENEEVKGVDFWIQDQYFDNIPVKTYFCFNCQAPQLYFTKDKIVAFQSKADIEKGDSFSCVNPYCKQSLTFLGIVKINPVVI